MADLVGPFDTAPWSMDQWYRFAPTWAPSGIIGTPASSLSTGNFAVTNPAALTASVAIGRAHVRGAGYETDAAKTLTVTANSHATFARRDRVVIRRDLAAKTVSVVRLTGTPASTPTAPALTQVDTGVWEIPVCSFLVPANSGTALSGFLDERTWVPDTDSRRGDVTLGEAALAATVVPTASAGAWTDVLSVTATSLGGAVVARWAGVAYNGNSGADRTMAWRVVCDDVAIGTGFSNVPLPVGSSATNHPRVHRTTAPSSTPAAGAHTWKLQANASAAAAVVVESASLTIVEK